jgi:chromosome segregation ATPase
LTLAGDGETRSDAHAELARERWEAHVAKHAGEKELADQKWEAHGSEHASIAHNLTEYKAQSNEWRGSLSDLRSTYTPLASHEAFEKEMRTALEGVNRRIDTEREERRDQQTLRAGQQEGISRTAAIAVTAIGLIGTLLGGLAVLLNILK